MPGWLKQGCVVLAGCLPLVLGIPGALALLLVMPMVVECTRLIPARFAGGIWLTIVTLASMALLPWQAIHIIAIWMMIGVMLLCYGDGWGWRRGIAWACGCVITLAAILITLNTATGGRIFPGLAEWAITHIDQSPDGPALLLQCYQMGLARLPDDMAPAISLMGMVLMTPAAHTQLLYSLRTTLESSLRMLLPQAAVGWCIITAVLAVLLPDVFRRKRGLSGRLPAFGLWQMSDGLRRHLNVIVLVYFLQLFTDSPVMSTMGAMAAAAFEITYVIFGLAVLDGVSKQNGTAKWIRRLWSIACLVFVPFVLIILVILDRVMDLRHLRGLMEDKGGV